MRILVVSDTHGDLRSLIKAVDAQRKAEAKTKAAAIWPLKIANGKFHGLMQTKRPRAGAVRHAAPSA